MLGAKRVLMRVVMVFVGFVCTLLDERALVDGARQLGFVFSVRTPQYVTVSTVSVSCMMNFA